MGFGLSVRRGRDFQDLLQRLLGNSSAGALAESETKLKSLSLHSGANVSDVLVSKVSIRRRGEIFIFVWAVEDSTLNWKGTLQNRTKMTFTIDGQLQKI